jgi:hypothetical protein
MQLKSLTTIASQSGSCKVDALCFHVPPLLSVPMFAIVLPCGLVAVADALLVMVNANLRLLRLLLAPHTL